MEVKKDQHRSAVCPTFYLGPVSYYACLLQFDDMILEVRETFIKQSYRNRCSIHGANGKLDLIIPLDNRRNRSKTGEIEIAYSENWQKLHWKSFEAAYRTSPYFEFYEADLKPFYTEKKYKNLVEFNTGIENVILELLEIDVSREKSREYLHDYEERHDFREAFHPKEKRKKIKDPLPSLNFNRYQQVFEDRNGFIADLSIVDLLFNKGPEAHAFLHEMNTSL